MSANEPGQPPQSSSPTLSQFTRDLTTPRVALAIGAHPDDIEFGCGGTLAKWASAGAIVHHLVLTDGSKGTWNVNADIEGLISDRKREQIAAAQALGCTGSVEFLGYVDGELEFSRDAIERVALHIRTIRPDIVLSHDPWKRYRLHPDHRNTGFIVTDAIVAARDPHFLKHQLVDGINHHRPDVLMLWEADEPNHVENITDSLSQKLSALESHASQFESTMKAVDNESLRVFRDRMTTRARELGDPHGVGAAEVFHLMNRL